MGILSICPRCKKRTLDRSECGESGLYGSRHLLCIPCWNAEDEEMESEGTNNLPSRLNSYGPENDYD